MKSAKGFLSIAFASIALCARFASAQFYAPDTEYHDRVERIFPVEAARIDAWLQNDGVKQVVYQVTNIAEKTVWEIRWLDDSSKAVREATVSYPRTLLGQGPEFYRSVLRQVSVGKRMPAPVIAPADARLSFWKGAGRTRLSREESLRELLKLFSKRSESSNATWRAEMAGALGHMSLPGMTYRLTLDNALVARSAAWLAMTEHACGGNLDELWAPILFQAGREQLASTLWTGVVKTNQANITVQQAGWNLWLRKPTSSQVFLFAAENGNLPMAMPMLAYDTWVNQSQSLLDDLVVDLVGGEMHLPALHNYAPLFAHRGTIGGGHLMNGAWPVVSRHAWLELLSAYQIEATDYREFTGMVRPALEAVRNLKADALKGELDSSLAGFKACVPLFRLGQKEGAGPLAPTAAITARDLLNYGWEMSGLQLGARYNFVQRRWGVPRQAAPIYRTVTTEVEGLVPFFMAQQYARIHNYVPCLQRLQCVEGFFSRVGFSPHPFSQMPNTPLENARLFVKRLWLRPLEFEWQARVLWDAESVAEIGPLMSALRDHGGSMANSHMLTYLTALDQTALEKVPGGTELKPALAKSLPQPSDMYYLAIAGHELAKLEPFPRAQAVERLYWRAPDSRLESRVFWQYLYAGAYKSARRFYTQVRKNLTDPVAFSNRMGRTAWLLGYLLDDPELRKMAIQDSASGSSADMMIQIWDAAARNNTKELQVRVQDYAGRYDSDRAGDTVGKRLLEFLPLLPALRDSAHEKREQALTHFGKTEMAAIIRWIWITEFKLPKADAIKFLGGRDTGLFPHVLVQYLEQDEKQTAEALRLIETSGNWRDENLLLGRHLWYKLQRQAELADMDLKPAQVSYIREAVAAKLNSTAGTREGK